MINTEANNKRFKFGAKTKPWWFLKKVKSMDIEYIFRDGKIVGCRFYHVYTRKEVIIDIGQYVTMDMLYAEELKRNKNFVKKRFTKVR